MSNNKKPTTTEGSSTNPKTGRSVSFGPVAGSAPGTSTPAGTGMTPSGGGGGNVDALLESLDADAPSPVSQQFPTPSTSNNSNRHPILWKPVGVGGKSHPHHHGRDRSHPQGHGHGRGVSTNNRPGSPGGRGSPQPPRPLGRVGSPILSEAPGAIGLGVRPADTKISKITQNLFRARQHSQPPPGTSTASVTSPDPGRSPTPSTLTSFHTQIVDLPENVMETIFSFLSLSDLRTVALVCSDWCRILRDENNDVWRYLCAQKLHPDIVHSALLGPLRTYKAKVRAYQHAWNPMACSVNIFVKPTGFTIHRNPVAQSTDAVRGKIGFMHGRHAWEVIWEGPLGTVAVVGVSTERSELRAHGYIPLLGNDDHSWGWNLVDNTLVHSGDSQGNYPLINNAPRYTVGERIRVILDCEDCTLAFEKDFEFLGVAFRGLPMREPLYPSISAVYGNTEVSMVYLGPPLDG